MDQPLHGHYCRLLSVQEAQPSIFIGTSSIFESLILKQINLNCKHYDMDYTTLILNFIVVLFFWALRIIAWFSDVWGRLRSLSFPSLSRKEREGSERDRERPRTSENQAIRINVTWQWCHYGFSSKSNFSPVKHFLLISIRQISRYLGISIKRV